MGIQDVPDAADAGNVRGVERIRNGDPALGEGGNAPADVSRGKRVENGAESVLEPGLAIRGHADSVDEEGRGDCQRAGADVGRSGGGGGGDVAELDHGHR